MSAGEQTLAADFQWYNTMLDWIKTQIFNRVNVHHAIKFDSYPGFLGDKASSSIQTIIIENSTNG